MSFEAVPCMFTGRAEDGHEAQLFGLLIRPSGGGGAGGGGSTTPAISAVELAQQQPQLLDATTTTTTVATNAAAASCKIDASSTLTPTTSAAADETNVVALLPKSTQPLLAVRPNIQRLTIASKSSASPSILNSSKTTAISRAGSFNGGGVSATNKKSRKLAKSVYSSAGNSSTAVIPISPKILPAAQSSNWTNVPILPNRTITTMPYCEPGPSCSMTSQHQQQQTLVTLSQPNAAFGTVVGPVGPLCSVGSLTSSNASWILNPEPSVAEPRNNVRTYAADFSNAVPISPPKSLQSYAAITTERQQQSQQQPQQQTFLLTQQQQQQPYMTTITTSASCSSAIVPVSYSHMLSSGFVSAPITAATVSGTAEQQQQRAAKIKTPRTQRKTQQKTKTTKSTTDFNKLQYTTPLTSVIASAATTQLSSINSNYTSQNLLLSVSSRDHFIPSFSNGEQNTTKNTMTDVVRLHKANVADSTLFDGNSPTIIANTSANTSLNGANSSDSSGAPDWASTSMSLLNEDNNMDDANEDDFSDMPILLPANYDNAGGANHGVNESNGEYAAKSDNSVRKRSETDLTLSTSYMPLTTELSEKEEISPLLSEATAAAGEMSSEIMEDESGAPPNDPEPPRRSPPPPPPPDNEHHESESENIASRRMRAAYDKNNDAMPLVERRAIDENDKRKEAGFTIHSSIDVRELAERLQSTIDAEQLRQLTSLIQLKAITPTIDFSGTTTLAGVTVNTVAENELGKTTTTTVLATARTTDVVSTIVNASALKSAETSATTKRLVETEASSVAAAITASAILSKVGGLQSKESLGELILNPIVGDETNTINKKEVDSTVVCKKNQNEKKIELNDQTTARLLAENNDSNTVKNIVTTQDWSTVMRIEESIIPQSIDNSTFKNENDNDIIIENDIIARKRSHVKSSGGKLSTVANEKDEEEVLKTLNYDKLAQYRRNVRIKMNQKLRVLIETLEKDFCSLELRLNSQQTSSSSSVRPQRHLWACNKNDDDVWWRELERRVRDDERPQWLPRFTLRAEKKEESTVHKVQKRQRRKNKIESSDAAKPNESALLKEPMNARRGKSRATAPAAAMSPIETASASLKVSRKTLGEPTSKNMNFLDISCESSPFEARKRSVPCSCDAEAACRNMTAQRCINRSERIECVENLCAIGAPLCRNRQFAALDAASAMTADAKLKLCSAPSSPTTKADNQEHGNNSGNRSRSPDATVFGVRTMEPLAKAQLVCEYLGEMISESTYQKRVAKKYGKIATIPINECYGGRVTDGYVLDATRKGNISRFISHSCQPNCELQTWLVGAQKRMGVFALRNIFSGETLTMNYANAKFLQTTPPFDCRCYCASAKCTGEIKNNSVRKTPDKCTKQQTITNNKETTSKQRKSAANNVSEQPADRNNRLASVQAGASLPTGVKQSPQSSQPAVVIRGEAPSRKRRRKVVVDDAASDEADNGASELRKIKKIRPNVKESTNATPTRKSSANKCSAQKSFAALGSAAKRFRSSFSPKIPTAVASGEKRFLRRNLRATKKLNVLSMKRPFSRCLAKILPPSPPLPSWTTHAAQFLEKLLRDVVKYCAAASEKISTKHLRQLFYLLKRQLCADCQRGGTNPLQHQTKRKAVSRIITVFDNFDTIIVQWMSDGVRRNYGERRADEIFVHYVTARQTIAADYCKKHAQTLSKEFSQCLSAFAKHSRHPQSANFKLLSPNESLNGVAAAASKSPTPRSSTPASCSSSKRYSLDAPSDAQKPFGSSSAFQKFSASSCAVTITQDADLSYMDSPHMVGSYDPDRAVRLKIVDEDCVRCICGIMEDDGVMTQCDKCNFWLHADCLDVEVNPDEEFICDFCTRSLSYTPNVDIVLRPQPRIRFSGCVYYRTLVNSSGIQVRVNETVYVKRLINDQHKQILRKLHDQCASGTPAATARANFTSTTLMEKAPDYSMKANAARKVSRNFTKQQREEQQKQEQYSEDEDASPKRKKRRRISAKNLNETTTRRKRTAKKPAIATLSSTAATPSNFPNQWHDGYEISVPVSDAATSASASVVAAEVGATDAGTSGDELLGAVTRQNDELYDRRELRTFRVERIFTGPNGERFVFGVYYARPHETFCDSSRTFYSNELFWTPLFDTLPLDAVVGRCLILEPTIWALGRPKSPKYLEEDVFICEYQIDRNQRSFEKIVPKNRYPINTEPYVFDRFATKLTPKRNFTPFILHASPNSHLSPPCALKKEEAKSPKNENDCFTIVVSQDADVTRDHTPTPSPVSTENAPKYIALVRKLRANRLESVCRRLEKSAAAASSARKHLPTKS